MGHMTSNDHLRYVPAGLSSCQVGFQNSTFGPFLATFALSWKPLDQTFATFGYLSGVDLAVVTLAHFEPTVVEGTPGFWWDSSLAVTDLVELSLKRMVNLSEEVLYDKFVKLLTCKTLPDKQLNYSKLYEGINCELAAVNGVLI